MKPAAHPELSGAIDAEARVWLRELLPSRPWILFPHRAPDADTLGSALALCSLLRRLGCWATIASADPIPERLQSLGDHEGVVVGMLPPDAPPGAGGITLDTGELGRLGCLAEAAGGLPCLVNLDHHISNRRFGSHNWIDLQAAATGEMVYLLYELFGQDLEAEAARALYGAIITDTSFFRLPSTTPRTHEITARLLATGFDAPRLVHRLYEDLPSSTVRLHGLALSRLRLSAGGRVAYCVISQALLAEAGAEHGEIEGIVDRLREIEGVEYAFVAVEHPTGEIRLSMRTKTTGDVNAIAAQFGGGGHLRSAGSLLNGSLEGVAEKVRVACEEALG